MAAIGTENPDPACDFFSPARDYTEDELENGIPVRDIVWMDQNLSPQRSRSDTNCACTQRKLP